MQFPTFDRDAIDIHSHLNHGVEGDSRDPIFEGLSISDLDFMLRDNARFGIREVGYSTYASVLTDQNIEAENDYLHALSKEREQVYQWVVVHPLIPSTFQQAEGLLEEKKVLGIKIHSPMHRYSIMEHGDRIFSFANERGAVVLMHPHKNADMTVFADRYPNMKLIIAHLDSHVHINAIKNAKHGNLYTDTSGCLSALNNVIEGAVEAVGSEKILFGTDTYSPASQYSRVALARISHRDKENILYKNALRLFEKAFD